MFCFTTNLAKSIILKSQMCFQSFDKTCVIYQNYNYLIRTKYINALTILFLQMGFLLYFLVHVQLPLH